MRHLNYLFLAPFFIIFSLNICIAQDTIKEKKYLEYSLINEDHSEGYNFPQEGKYFEYIFPSGVEHLQNTKEILFELQNKNIVVVDCWYKVGQRSCSPPGSRVASQVIVKPRLILRIDKLEDSQKINGFENVEIPKQIRCGYSVQRYTLKR